MFLKIVYILITLYCSAVIQTAEGQSILEVYNASCFKTDDRIKSIECEYIKFAPSRYGFSVRVMFARDVAKSFRVHLSGDVMPKDSNKALRMFDVSLNACTFLKQMTTNQLLAQIVKELKRTTNIPTTCPFKSNFLYRQDNFSVTGDYVPAYGPSFKFTFTVELFERNKLLCGWQLVGAKVN